MNSRIWIILGVGIGSYAAYRFYKNNSRKEVKEPTESKIKPEIADYLCMQDVIGYFKGLKLKKGEDKPFIAQGEEMKKGLDLADKKYDGLEIICLGRLNGKSDEIMNFQALACKEVGKDIKEILGSDKLVVLN